MLGATGVTNRTSRRSTLTQGRSRATLLLAASCLVFAGSAAAAIDLSADISLGGDYNTNALDRSSRDTSGGDRDDASARLTAGISARTAGEGATQLQMRLQSTKVDSLDRNELDRWEHNLSATLDWRPHRAFDASVRGSYTRLPLSLADVGGERAALQEVSEASVTVRVRPTPQWQLSLTPPGWSQTRTPLGTDEFRTREKTYIAALDFLGAGRLVPGISASHVRGRNSEIANATRYRQDTLQGTLTYRATERSTFSLAAGKAKRKTRLIVPSTDPIAQANERDDEGFAGSLSVFRQLTAKTSVSFSAFRTLQQYEVNLNPAISTGFAAGVVWAATAKISANFDIVHTWSKIEGLQESGAIRQRNDLFRTYQLGIGYRATQRFTVGTYVARRVRNSDLSYNSQFNGTTAGLNLTLAFD